MSHRQGLNVFRDTQEDDAIISGTKPEATLPFAVKRLNISSPRRAELVNRLQNTQRCRPIDRTKLRPGFRCEGENQNGSSLRVVPEDFFRHFVQIATDDVIPAVRLGNALPDRLGEPGTNWFV
jgi:hypothetical protein